MSDIEKKTVYLDELFDAARSYDADLPDQLAQRIITDARIVQNERHPNSHRSRPGVLSQIMTLLGGWPAIGGLATACAAGIWLGFAPPAAIPDPISFIQQSEAALFSDDDLLSAMIEEG